MNEFSEEQLEAVATQLAERAGTSPFTEPIEVTIGEFADRDPEQGKAIDHAIATGEPLFAEPVTEPAKPADDPIVPKHMTRKVWKEMMRIHFTVRRPTVKSCGHKINIQADPRNNCEDCWFAYFQNNGQMTQIADECWTQAGRDVLERSRGKKFVKYFLMFMSTIARFQREAAAAEAEKARTNGEQKTYPASASDAGLNDNANSGEPATNRSIGGVAGEAQNIGGLSSDPSVNDFVAENPLDGETS